MASDLFGIGLSGLLVSQRGLATTGHNIANVNTEGYSRQRVEQGTRPAEGTGAGFLGQGVETTTVRRIVDRFLVEQVRTSTTSAAGLETFHDLARQVDSLLANPSTGLSPALQGFFSSLHQLSDDPSSIPARQVVLGDATGLANRFRTLQQRLAELERGVGTTLVDVVSEVNTFTRNIAELNQKIALAEASFNGQPANDLRDQREELLRRLAGKVGIGVIEQADGAVNVTIGGGQALVVGATAATLTVTGSGFDPARGEVAYSLLGINSVITDRISGGELGAALDFRRDVLEPAQDALGRVAMGVATHVNRQHALGVDLNGALGGDFFTDIASTSPRVLGHPGNTGAPPAAIDVVVADVSVLSAAEYRLARTASGFELTRSSDGTVFNLGSFPGAAQTVDGLTLSLASGTIAVGDSFLIQPVRRAAADIAVALSAPGDIAAAAPILTTASLANAGSGSVSAGVVNAPDNRVRVDFTAAATFDVTDETTGATLATGLTYAAGGPIRFNGWTVSITGAPAAGDRFVVDHTVSQADPANAGTGAIGLATIAAPDPDLRDPVTITFDTPPSTFTVTGASTGTPTVNVPYTPGAPISFNGWTLSIAGAPAAGDVFTITSNTNGVGDNRNARLLAGLQTSETLESRQATFGESYGRLVAQVGTLTEQAEINRTAQSFLLEQAVEAREEVSGVNLEEEAANLLRLQQAFQASAQLIAAADELLDALLGIVAGR